MIAGAGVAQADSGPPGDIPDNQAFVTFRGAGYSLKVPEGWPWDTARRSRHVRGQVQLDHGRHIGVGQASPPSLP